MIFLCYYEAKLCVLVYEITNFAVMKVYLWDIETLCRRKVVVVLVKKLILVDVHNWKLRQTDEHVWFWTNENL